MRLLRLLAATLVVLAAAGSAWSGDPSVLKTYKGAYTDKAYLSAKEEILDDLAAVGDPKALPALLWCIDQSRALVAKREKNEAKLRKALQPLEKEYRAKYEKYAAQQVKQGNPMPDKHPRWPVFEKVMKARADLEHAQREIADEQALVTHALASHGKLIASLPEDSQAKIREKWVSGALAHRDWKVRADQWTLVGGVPTTWAMTLLVDGAAAEADPRVLIWILEGLGGRDEATVLPVLETALEDVRWTVRVAALGALEKTPSKQTIEITLALLEREPGRVQDDCARVLRTMTGQEFGPNLAQWKNWWLINSAGWTGPPEPEKETDEKGDDVKPDPEEEWKKAVAESDRKKGTGFFGIDTRSKRIVYVIDVSGSMNEKAGESGDATRADRAKEELRTAVLGLDDGALFNIVFFAGDVRLWKKEMTIADSETRVAAVEFIDKMPVVGGTATYDALEAAFGLGDVGRGKKRGADPSGDSKVDTVILLSDGKPSVGEKTQPDAIRADVLEWFGERRIAVHTVAFGKDADLDFMAGLAKDTGGTHVAK